MTDTINQPESGYKILNLLLLESNFIRLPQIDFDNNEFTTNSKLDIKVDTPSENTLIVTETLTYERIAHDSVEVSAKIVMAGVFERFGNAELSLQAFGNVNAAAIIFPYVREILSDLSIRSGIGLILLPPIAFNKRGLEEELKKE